MSLRTLTLCCVLSTPLMMSAIGCQPTPIAATQTWQRTELYFGRSTNIGGHVSDAEWDAFVNAEITPRFPAGSTIFDAHGQWADPKGKLVHEDSRVLVLLYEPSAEIDQKIETIRQTYVKNFSQDAVMRVDSPARVRF